MLNVMCGRYNQALRRRLRLPVLAAVCGFLLHAGGFAGALEPADTGASNVVARITIRTDRLCESIVRGELAFREGEPLVPEAIAESRRNLLQLNLLKTLTIESDWDEALQGLHVRVEAEDGWFVLPWPMVGSRGGSRYFSLTLMQLNYFRHAESLVLMGMAQDDEWSGLAAFSHPRYALMAGLFSSSRTEYAYLDGGFSIIDFERGFGPENPADFGAIERAYDKRIDRVQLQARLPLGDDWRLSLGGKDVRTRYAAATDLDPPDPDESRALTLALERGRAGPSQGGEGFVGIFARIFGLGMAAAHDSRTPLLATRTTWGMRTMLEVADRMWGSNARFIKGGLAIQRHTQFRNRNTLSFYAQGGWSDGLPSGQKLSTGGESGMRGVYAREYRGNRAVVLGALWTGSLWRDRFGMLGVNGFAETASVWQGQSQGDKHGVGAGVNYRFWRFPFPIGAGYTYSLDDRNGQISVAMGCLF